MRQSLVTKFLVVSVGIGLVIGFQNCAPGFEVLSVETLTSEAAGVPEIQLAIEIPELGNLRTMAVSFDLQLPPGQSLKSLTCQLNDELPQDCMNGFSLVDLADGPYVLRINAEDSNGRKAEEVVRTFEVDATAPAVTASSLPPALNSLSSVSIPFAAMDNRSAASSLKYRCAFDDQAFTDCVSPIVLKDIAPGDHRVRIAAMDEAGNVSSEYSHSWKMDTGVPSLTISTAPEPMTKLTTATFVFSGMDDGKPITKFECKLDAGTYRDCSTGSLTFSSLAVGPHKFSLRGLDTDGVFSQPTERSWIIDRVVPELPVVMATITDKIGQTPSARFMFTSTDNSGAGPTFECSFNTNVYVPCSSPQNFVQIAKGTNTFRVVAVDGAGNKSAPKTYSWHSSLYIPLPHANPDFRALAGSDVNDLAYSNGVLYAATNSGLSISTDGGATYSTRTVLDAFPANSIIAVSANGSIVCVIAGSSEVFMSRDGGKTFGSKLIANDRWALQATHIHCDDKVIVAVGGHGLWSSVDGGLTFQEIQLPVGVFGINRMKYSEGTLYFVSGTKLFFSKDLGKTINTATGLPTQELIFSLAASGDTVYVTAGNDVLYGSSDGGASFTRRDASMNGKPAVLRWGIGAIDTNAIYAIADLDVTTQKYAIAKSIDGGKTFTQLNEVFNVIEGVRHLTSQGRIVIVGNQIYVPTEGGIGVTDSSGTSLPPKTSPWSTINSMCGIGNRIFVGTQTGVMRTTDGGASFTRLTTANGLGGNEVQSMRCSGTTLYVKTKEGLAISKDYGATFVNRTQLADPSVVYRTIFTVDGGKIYAFLATKGMAVSTDEGQTFTMIPGFNPSVPYATALAVDGAAIYMASIGSLYRSVDGGAVELIDYRKLGYAYEMGIYRMKVINGVLWIGTDYNATISTDKGATFKLISSKGVLDFSSYGNTVYMGVASGFISTSDNGATLTPNNYGGSAVGVYADGTSIYVATPSGVHKLR